MIHTLSQEGAGEIRIFREIENLGALTEWIPNKIL